MTFLWGQYQGKDGQEVGMGRGKAERLWRSPKPPRLSGGSGGVPCEGERARPLHPTSLSHGLLPGGWSLGGQCSAAEADPQEPGARESKFLPEVDLGSTAVGPRGHVLLGFLGFHDLLIT